MLESGSSSWEDGRSSLTTTEARSTADKQEESLRSAMSAADDEAMSSSPRRIQVSFADDDVVHDHIHIADYTYEERRLAWYSPDDIKTIKAHVLAEATMMARGHPETQDVVCYRGLEYKTKQAALQRRHTRIDAKAAVLLEQEMQREDEIFDEQAVADAYYEVTQASQEKAHQIGLQDQVQVQLERQKNEGNTNLLDLLLMKPASVSSAPHQFLIHKSLQPRISVMNSIKSASAA